MDESPALALVEVGSLSRAYLVLDALVKQAPVTVLAHQEVSPGKTLITFCGGESEVEEALTAARVSCGEHLLDHLYLPNAHPSLVTMLRGAQPRAAVESILAVETRTAAAAVRAGDAALKAAAVELLRVRLARGLGGKGILVFSGPLHDVEAAAIAARDAAGDGGFHTLDVIPQPHPEIVGFLVDGKT